MGSRTETPMATSPQIVKSTSTISTKPIAAAAIVQSTTTKASDLVQNKGSAGSNPDSKQNPPQGFEGPSPNLPAVSKPSADSFAPKTATDKQATIDQAMGRVSQNTAVQTLFGAGTGTSAVRSERDRLTDLQGSTANTNRPSIDQGFTSKPASLASNPLASANPMDPFKEGSVGGALEVAASAGVKAPGQGGAIGSGMVSASLGTAVAVVGIIKATADVVKVGADIGALPLPAIYGGGGAGAATVATATAGVATAALGGIAAGTLIDNTYQAATGSTIGDDWASMDQKLGLGIGNVTVAVETVIRDLFSTPNPENTGSNVNILTQTLLNQLNAANAGKPVSQGGGGDITPATNSGMDVVARNGSLASNQASLQGQNLFGQPVNPAFENVSGGNKGISIFSSGVGAGAINPGNDAGSPAGDRKYADDPGIALGGNKPAPALPALNPPATTTSGGQGGQSSSLDNLINGNADNNVLRGEAGNDLLDGGAGCDVLTGGTGADRFRFATAGAFGTAQADRITDFSRSEGDRIELSRSAFGLSNSVTISFEAVNNDADLSRMLSSGTLLVQDLRDGSLLFNQNGSAAGAGLGGLFATLNPGLMLQGNDFTLIA